MLTEQDFQEALEDIHIEYDCVVGTMKASKNCLELHEKERDEFAMGFIEWALLNNWEFCNPKYNEEDYVMWLNSSGRDVERVTTKELLTIYKDSLNADKT